MPAMSGPRSTGDPAGAGSVPLESRVLTLWRLRAGSGVVVVAVLCGVVIGASSGALTAGIITAAVATGVGGGLAWWWTALIWRAWRFEIGEHALHLRHGVLTRRASTIPFHRVQHIDLEAGPLERRLRLTSLILRTASASSDSEVPGIDADDAVALRSRILALVGTGDAT